jgi:hypothetical protein
MDRRPPAQGLSAMPAPQRVRLQVFGERMDAEFDGTRWRLFAIGDGKRAPVDAVIPQFICADEVAQYLSDLWHEAAPARDPTIVQLPDA